MAFSYGSPLGAWHGKASGLVFRQSAGSVIISSCERKGKRVRSYKQKSQDVVFASAIRWEREFAFAGFSLDRSFFLAYAYALRDFFASGEPQYLVSGELGAWHPNICYRSGDSLLSPSFTAQGTRPAIPWVGRDLPFIYTCGLLYPGATFCSLSGSSPFDFGVWSFNKELSDESVTGYFPNMSAVMYASSPYLVGNTLRYDYRRNYPYSRGLKRINFPAPRVFNDDYIAIPVIVLDNMGNVLHAFIK